MNLDSKSMRLAALFSFIFIPLIATDCPKTCTDYTIPVNPTSLNLIWAKPFANNYDVVDFFTGVASRNASADFFSSAKIQTASYQISATFCTPTNSTSNNNVVLLLTHGVNFDRRSVHRLAHSDFN